MVVFLCFYLELSTSQTKIILTAKIVSLLFTFGVTMKNIWVYTVLQLTYLHKQLRHEYGAWTLILNGSLDLMNSACQSVTEATDYWLAVTWDVSSSLLTLEGILSYPIHNKIRTCCKIKQIYRWLMNIPENQCSFGWLQTGHVLFLYLSFSLSLKRHYLGELGKQ